MTRSERKAETHRKAEASIEVHDGSGRACAGVPVWVAQQTHAFVFGCSAPPLEGEAHRRWHHRALVLFNRLVPAGQAPNPEVRRYDVPPGINLGRARFELDRLAALGQPLQVYLRGTSIGLGATDAANDADCQRVAAERITSLYTLCFAHPAVRGIYWEGFWDGEPGCDATGLVRLDFRPRLPYRFLNILLGRVWQTRAQGTTDAEGRFRFRGFFGDYHVSAWRSEQETATAQFTHAHAAGLPCLLQLAGT